jgi:hypothetical protein
MNSEIKPDFTFEGIKVDEEGKMFATGVKFREPLWEQHPNPSKGIDMGNNILSARFRDSIPGSRVTEGTKGFSPPDPQGMVSKSFPLRPYQEDVAKRIAAEGRRFGDFMARNGTFGARPSSRFSYNAYELPKLIVDFEANVLDGRDLNILAQYINQDTEYVSNMFPISNPKRHLQISMHHMRNALGKAEALYSMARPMPKLRLLTVAMKAAFPVKG